MQLTLLPTTFSLLFHSPVAVQLEVGYSEDDEIYVDLQPLSERDDCINDTQLMELEGVAYSEAHKLDDLVASFAHSIFDFLYGQDHHSSLHYTKYKALLAAEQAYKASASVKKAYDKLFPKFTALEPHYNFREPISY